MSTKSIELNDLFDYGYKIYQDPDYFKFSLDSVLLAEFVDIKNGQKEILDFCSGNAPIPMILSSKYGNNINITGIELQEEIYNLGLMSINYNGFKNITYLIEDVNNLPIVFKNKKFNIVTCNPPYFKVNGTNLTNENETKAIARHEIKIDLESIIKVASKVLENQGYLYMVHRADRLADIVILFNKYKFGLKRIVPVYSKRDMNANLILIEAIYNGKDYVIVDNPIYLDELKSYKNIFER